MKRRIASVVMTLLLALNLLPTAALADDDVGTPDTAVQMPAYSGGSGTAAEPWLISTVDDLKTLAETVNNGKATKFDADCTDEGDGIPGNYLGYYFKQTANLDLSSIENWDPIGYSGSGLYFAGNYDGAGYTISGAKSTGKNDDAGYATAGIFGWVAFGSVENLTVKNADFLATCEGGLTYAYVGGIAAVTLDATIQNCTVTNSNLDSAGVPNFNFSSCTGGIVGCSTDSTFFNCASIMNEINSQMYAGGFVGENDDDSNATYTNCYTADCSVKAITQASNGTSYAGGFIGMTIADDIKLENCYVYRAVLSTEETAAHLKATGVFAAYFYTNGSAYTSQITTTSCFYGECGITNNAGTATEMKAEEFTNGTVANALGEAFVQGKNYPVFATDPADYTAVDAAIARVNDLTEADYTDFSAVKRAVAEVVRDKKIKDQDEVDAMAQAIENAIAKLVKKPTSSDGGSSRPTYTVTVPAKTDHGTVTVSPKNASRGDTVTITATPDKGYTLETITVTDKDGKALKLTDKGNGKYAFTMPAGKVEVKATFMDDNTMLNYFVDVKASDYFYDAVLWAAEKGITSGTDAMHFSPDADCTRAQIVTFLWRAAGSPVVNYAMNLEDVPAEAYYAEAVRWALSEGIATGTTATAFDPDAVCTRAQAVAFLFRYAASKGMNAVTLQELVSGFADADTVPAYALPAMNWALAADIVKGDGQNLMPESSCTRAQIVTFLFRAYQAE